MLISIIIPCYNGEAVVNRAISSVFLQEYPKVELVVVDDGSTDDSKDVICSWQPKFEEKGWLLKYVYQENKGLGGAINTGLKHITGDYMMLLDADDEYLAGAVAKLSEYLNAHPECDVVRANGWVVRGEHRHLFVYEKEEKECRDIFVPLLRGETCNWAGSYMVRTKALFAFYPESEIYTSRFGQNLQILLPLTYGKPSGFIDEPIMNYIQEGESLSRVTDEAAAKKRSLDNAAGYRDIRLHVLGQIVHDAKIRNMYLRQIDGAYWRYIMQIADEHTDIGLLKDAYARLCKEEKPQLRDKIRRYRRTAPIIAFLLRVYGKLKRMIG